jgi:hypothetical protein
VKRAVSLALVGLLAVGCEIGTAPEQTTGPSLLTRPPPGRGFQCLQALSRGVLRADPAVPGAVWLDRSDGATIRLKWPHGYTVRFNAEVAEVLAPSGEIVAREGDAVELTGGTVQNTFEICRLNGRLP